MSEPYSLSSVTPAPKVLRPRWLVPALAVLVVLAVGLAGVISWAILRPAAALTPVAAPTSTAAPPTSVDPAGADNAVRAGQAACSYS
jgi:hypothetical protein